MSGRMKVALLALFRDRNDVHFADEDSNVEQSLLFTPYHLRIVTNFSP